MVILKLQPLTNLALNLMWRFAAVGVAATRTNTEQTPRCSHNTSSNHTSKPSAAQPNPIPTPNCFMTAIAMTNQTMGQSSQNALPVRGLLACRYDSQSTVSTLSLGSCMADEPNPATSIGRLDRFKASCTDRKLTAPGRKQSLHNVVTPRDSVSSSGSGLRDSSTLPPRIPSRQDTADRKHLAEAMKGDDRPGLNRVSGGINVFGS